MSVDLTDSKSIALHTAAREYAIGKAKDLLVDSLYRFRFLADSELIDDPYEEITERVIRTFNLSKEQYIITGGSIDR